VAPVIEFRRSYNFDVSPRELWAVLDDPAAFERWWPWLRRFEVEGGSIRTGAVLRGVVSPPLPYRMRVEVELLRVRRPSFAEAAVRGDLEGTAAVSFKRSATGTSVEASWVLEMMQPAMRLASLLAHPLLVRGHDAVVDMTVAGVKRRLAEGR
jgi:uncharacterized protein YndB with AHSA1/START domain